MRFLKIKYENYRCFKDAVLNFVTDDKNISLVIAPNGGGKTEMLFSFWWVLYDFDFRDLKGKEDTPYSLNSGLYRKLVESNENKSYSCAVELEFENDDTVYIIKRTEKFYKTKGRIESEQMVELSSVSSIGEKSLPERNKEVVEKRLTKIIPKNILYGIIFDGERMKQLSSVDELSKKAVESVIKHITNEELFELCRTEFADLEKKINSELKRVAKKTNNYDLESIVRSRERCQNDLNTYTISLAANKHEIEEIKPRLSYLSDELKKNSDSQKFELLRQKYRQDLEKRNKELEMAIDEFYKSLYDGYFLIGKHLFDDVRDSIEHKDVPFGLTVDAVKSIMERSKCICGHCIGDEERQTMEALIDSLPPDNIGTKIDEMLRYTELHVEDVKKALKKAYARIEELKKAIDNIKGEIAYAGSQIIDGASEIVKGLEEENNKLMIRQSELEKSISDYEKIIEARKNEIERLNKEEMIIKEVTAEVALLRAKYHFVQKFKTALNEIDEYNKSVSLENINEKVIMAYAQISEDYSRGRRLYIVQFDIKKKYRLVSYYQQNFDNMKKTLIENGTIAALISMGKSEKEINENVLLRVLESNSTGQSKINTLAFAKAILDYSNEDRDDNTTEITKDYPFLIDSPFTELTDDNLIKSAASLHEFARQIILMSSADSLSSVKDLIMPYVGSIVFLEKADNESLSILKECN